MVWYNETRLSSVNCELGVIIFGSVRFLSKKVTKPKLFFFEKNRNRVKPNGFGSVRFFRFGSVGSVFFRFLSVSVRFFWFFLIKPKPNQTGWFFQNFNRFFFSVRFFRLFFFQFSRFNRFSGFFLTSKRDFSIPFGYPVGDPKTIEDQPWFSIWLSRQRSLKSHKKWNFEKWKYWILNIIIASNYFNSK